MDASQSDRLDRRRNLEPDSAALLNIVLRCIDPRRVLELGTSNGFSTIWLADALEPGQGRVLTVDNDHGRAAQATDNFIEAGVADCVEQVVDDAARVLAE